MDGACWFWARYEKADCFWLVIAPIGVIVSRWPTREQAVEEVERLNYGVSLSRARREQEKPR